MPMKSGLKKGDVVEIYEDYYTEYRNEGQAKLIKFIREDEVSEWWEVKFLEDNYLGVPTVERRIKKQQGRFTVNS